MYVIVYIGYMRFAGLHCRPDVGFVEATGDGRFLVWSGGGRLLSLPVVVGEDALVS
jgi:hypothetical protein